jgi:hypothetical protein
MRHNLPDGETFVGEPIEPKPGSFDTGMMARGGPGLPRAFTWCGREYQVLGVMDSWHTKERGHGMDREYHYVRRHYYRIKTTTGEIMTISFDRKPQGERGRQRWSLFSIANS